MPSSTRKQFASLTLGYNQQDYIESCLRYIAPTCDAMFVLHSERPFTKYNPLAREEFHETDRTGDILEKLGTEYGHLHVLQGLWDSEDEMRNEGIRAALDCGFEYLMIVDADEFLKEKAWPALHEFVLDNPNADSWWCQMRVPFKYADRVIDRDDEFLPIVVRLTENIRFVNRRIPSGRRIRLPTRFTCYNMGFLLADDRMFEKTRTWSHAHQLPGEWYQEKWVNWTPHTTNLHTRDPSLWRGTRWHDVNAFPRLLHNHPIVLERMLDKCRL